MRRDYILHRLALSLLVAALFVTACALPSVNYPPPSTRDFGDITPYGSVPGIVALLFGAGSEAALSWSANLFLLTGWILLLCRMNTLAMIFGWVAVVLGLTAWAYVSDQMQLLVGYYFWEGSMVVFALGATAIKLYLSPAGMRSAPSKSARNPASPSAST